METKTNTFKHFPESQVCPVCGSSEDLPCFLVPIAGTEEGRIAQACPIHEDCIEFIIQTMWYERDKNLLYSFVDFKGGDKEKISNDKQPNIH